MPAGLDVSLSILVKIIKVTAEYHDMTYYLNI